MGRVAAGIAATLILGFAGPAAAQTIGDEIQNEEKGQKICQALTTTIRFLNSPSTSNLAGHGT
jgi:hypothetical protein